MQTVLAIDHDLVALFQPFVDQGEAVFDLCNFDGLDFYGLIGINDEGVGAIRAALDDLGGNDEAVRSD